MDFFFNPHRIRNCKILFLNCSGDNLFASLEAGYLEQCANNLKVTLVAADTPNQVCVSFSVHSMIQRHLETFRNNKRNRQSNMIIIFETF